MMNPYFLMGVLIFFVASVAGSGYKGYELGRGSEIARRATADDVERRATEAASYAAANAIAALKPVYTTIKQQARVDHEKETVYIDCRLPSAGVLRINSAIAGKTSAAPDSGKLPADKPADTNH